MKIRNQSLQERKRSKSQLKASKSQQKHDEIDDYDFYAQFQKFYQEVQHNNYRNFEYMQEFFNLGIKDFPSCQEVLRLQKHILDTSGWANQLKKNWNLEEKKVLIWIVGMLSQEMRLDIKSLSQEFWEEVSKMICRRDADMCKQKWASMQKIALQQQPFSLEEDRKLLQIIQEFQSADQGQKWSQIAAQLNQFSNIYRSSKQCRERWLNHLNPNISKDPWSDEEDIVLLNFVKDQGRRWAEISKLMDGRRSENTLKNRFNSLIKREKDLVVTNGNKKINLEEALGSCSGSDLSDLQKRALDVLIQKVTWRTGEQQKKSEYVRQSTVDMQLTQEEVRRGFQRAQMTPSQVKYNIGHMDHTVPLPELIPCLVNMHTNMIYFCPSEIIIQVINSTSQHKDSFERLKSEISLFDVGFQHQFRSTLNMIEEIEDSQVSQSVNNYFVTDDMDHYFNLETPQTFSKPQYLNAFERISHRAFNFIRNCKTELEISRHQNYPRSLPQIIQRSALVI